MVATCSATRSGSWIGSWKMPVPTRKRRRAGGDRHHERERVALVARHEVVMADGDGVEARLFGDAGELEALPERIAVGSVAKDGQ